jgi:hypothetical protein
LKDYGKAVRKILTEAGCEFLRQGRGDHEIWTSPNASKPFTLPVTIPSRHLANKILTKDAGFAEGVLNIVQLPERSADRALSARPIAGTPKAAQTTSTTARASRR